MEIGLVPLYPEIDTDIIEIEIEIVTQPSATNNPNQPNILTHNTNHGPLPRQKRALRQEPQKPI